MTSAVAISQNTNQSEKQHKQQQQGPAKRIANVPQLWKSHASSKRTNFKHEDLRRRGCERALSSVHCHSSIATGPNKGLVTITCDQDVQKCLVFVPLGTFIKVKLMRISPLTEMSNPYVSGTWRT